MRSVSSNIWRKQNMGSKYHSMLDMTYEYDKKTYIRVGPYGTEDKEYYRSATNGYFFVYGRNVGKETIGELYEILNKEWIEAEKKLDKKQETESMAKKDKVTVKNDITQEKKELDNKIEKLKRFTLSIEMTKLSRNQIHAMHKQLSAMETYSLALRDRIIDITSQEGE